MLITCEAKWDGAELKNGLISFRTDKNIYRLKLQGTGWTMISPALDEVVSVFQYGDAPSGEWVPIQISKEVAEEVQRLARSKGREVPP